IGFFPRTALAGSVSPDGEGAEHRERKNDDAEMEPGAIAAGVLGKDEQMDGEPEANCKTDRDPRQVARRLVDRPDMLDLRAGDARRDEDQNGDENRSNGQAAKPDGPGHLAGSFRPIHWQLTSVNCASVMNIYSSSLVSARGPRSFALH